jgi:hypothetical protein
MGCSELQAVLKGQKNPFEGLPHDTIDLPEIIHVVDIMLLTFLPVSQPERAIRLKKTRTDMGYSIPIKKPVFYKNIPTFSY